MFVYVSVDVCMLEGYKEKDAETILMIEKTHMHKILTVKLALLGLSSLLFFVAILILIYQLVHHRQDCTVPWKTDSPKASLVDHRWCLFRNPRSFLSSNILIASCLKVLCNKTEGT